MEPENIKWTSKCVIFIGIWLDVLDIVEFCSWSISIQIQLKEIQSLNVHLNRKLPKNCVNTFRSVALSMQKKKNRPGYFGNIPNPSLKNTIMMVSTDAIKCNCLVVGL